MKRMQELIAVIDKRKECTLDWLLGWGGLRWGSTEESIMRMLRQLEKASMIEIDDEFTTVKSLHPRENDKNDPEKK